MTDDRLLEVAKGLVLFIIDVPDAKRNVTNLSSMVAGLVADIVAEAVKERDQEWSDAVGIEVVSGNPPPKWGTILEYHKRRSVCEATTHSMDVGELEGEVEKLKALHKEANDNTRHFMDRSIKAEANVEKLREALSELLKCHACGGFVEPDEDLLEQARKALQESRDG